MIQHQTLEGCLSEIKMLERVKYFPRQLLTADDMKADQEYVRNKLRRHNRYLHGWGSVCGLEVAAATEELPWRVKITEGYALGPYGNEIYVREPVFLDLARCGPSTITDPCDPDFLRTPGLSTGEQLFVAIKYAECLAKPVRAMPTGCGCEEEACEYSRIRDSFQIECLTELPPSHEPPPGPMLCDLIEGKQLPACPPCPAEPWVVLAQVNLPASPSTDIENSNIDNFTFRRQIFSTGVLQEQLIKCCCAPEKRPAQVVSVEPRDVTFTVGLDEIPSEIVIRFDKSLQEETISTGTTGSIQVTRFARDTSRPGIPIRTIIDGEVLYDDSIKSVRFLPVKAFEEGLQDGSFEYSIALFGDGPKPIRDKDDLALDGNGDRSSGGTFLATLFKIKLSDID